MSRNGWILLLIVFMAAGLRLVRLAEFPPGLHFDEASIAYNAWSIAVWHRDEWVHFMPLSFQSFGDHKPPLVIYLLAIAYWFFGLQPYWVRGLSALSGVLTVIVGYGVAKELLCSFQKEKGVTWVKSQTVRSWFPLLVASMLALSPWGITLSRVGYEQNTAFLLVNVGVWSWLKSLRKPRWLIVSVIVTSLSLYTFHTAKIFWLGFGAIFLWSYRRYFITVKKWLALSGLIGAMLVMPLIVNTFIGEGGARGEALIVFRSGYEPASFREIALELLQNSLKQFSLGFWIRGEDGVSVRHSVPGHGVITVAELLLLTAGIGWSLVYVRWSKTSQLLLSWWVMGLMPAILTHGNPHALRSLFALMPSVILVAIGASSIWVRIGKANQVVAKLVGVGLLGLYVWGLGTFFASYISDYPQQSAKAFQYGYEEAFAYITRHQGEVEKTVITDSYGHPYIYALLFNRIEPQAYQFGALQAFEFRPIRWPEVQTRRLWVGTPEEIPTSDPRVVKVITLPDSDRAALVIAKT